MEKILKKLKLSEGKRAQCFQRLQAIFNLLPKLTDKSIKAQFITQARLVDQLRTEFRDNLDEINLLNLDLNPDYEVSYQSLDSFDNLYYAVKEEYSKLVKPEPSLATPKSESVQQVCKEDSIRLPRINLPMFSGEIQDFPFFHETFKRMVHDNSRLEDSERVHYLFNHLTGNAKTVCSGVIPCAENYNIVWDALISKYHDPRALATSYLNELFAMKPLSGPSALNLERFIDKFSAIISALNQLKIENLSEFIFIHHGLKLLDADTAKSFEMSIKREIMPKYDSFTQFVRDHAKILNRTSQRSTGKVESRTASSSSLRTPQPREPRAPQAYVSTQFKNSKNDRSATLNCILCNNDDHAQLYCCNKFQSLAPHDRYNYVKDIKACTNCLSNQHTSIKCRSHGLCRKCRGKHHTLLHFNDPSKPAEASQLEVDASIEKPADPLSANEAGMSPTKVSFCSLSAVTRSGVPSTEILATAKVFAVNKYHREVPIRCLLDPASQKHYVTADCCKLLGLSINRNSASVVKGIGGVTQPIRGSVDITFSSRFKSEKKYTIEALVLDKITTQLPTCQVDGSSLDSFNQVPLADDTWNIPGAVDLLIGVKLFTELVLSGKIVTTPGLPDALETALGYVVLGDAPVLITPSSTLSFCATEDIGNLIQKFWEVDSFGERPILSVEDTEAEKIYKSTTTREVDGRYKVALPFKLDSNNLGDSYKVAARRFTLLEHKFNTQPTLKLLYDEVIKDHLDKKYLIPVDIKKDDRAYYIPHHGVLREEKISSKLRVVLDASAVTDSGLSLNDLLHTGPSLQADLFSIMVNLRLFPIAISADVRQMYLSILMREADRCFQRILYRLDSREPVKAFQYRTVTFGVKSSPFLALRTLKRLVEDEGVNFPVAKEVVSRDIYMDDIATSVLNIDEAVETTKQLDGLFKAGGFQLAKWSSNSVEALKEIPSELYFSSSISFDNDENILKILGLRWFPNEDVFAFQVTPDHKTCTKRNILSSVARLFDVLGLVAPVIVYAKLLIKELWALKIDWDELPPAHIARRWQFFQSELPQISNIKIPRHIGVSQGCSATILGFADASEKAYGAAVYMYVCSPDKDPQIQLICAKSKVAPLKVISLARLELCGTLLLSQLIKKVLNCYAPRYALDSVLAFSDSTVALSWIHSSPHRWQTFVANRVTKVHENLSSKHFYHIKGTENPSDCLSRGLTPAQLVNHPLWFHGPPWIKNPRSEWPIKCFIPEETGVPEAKSVSLVTCDPNTENIIYDMSKRFSSWTKYIRSVAYVLKFTKKLQRGPINATDLIYSESQIFRSLQNIYFSQDISNIKNNKPCTPTLKKLVPFLDNGIIRVGGRLSNSGENYNYKHPILLPHRDHILEILIDYSHRKNFHAGPETLMSILRHNYWIISARSIIRQRIHRCIFCFKVKPRTTFPIMADLPSARVNQVDKAFTLTGCDYAGPLYCTPIRRRGVKSQKTYLCIFTCMTTRAVHIELASDLSTVSFISALKRFLSRRGPVRCMYSDNGTNFVGANTYLRELYNFLATEYKQYWEQELAEKGISWSFIPPSAPHFGGCWESTVKCVKTHLFRSIGKQILSHEELLTTLTQIEAILNSRPLCVLSSDPSEPLPLTPAHFLNIVPLTHFPSSPLRNPTLLERYQLLEQIIQSFWNRWKNDYLHTLQIRQRWNTPENPIVVGTIVLVNQDNIAPLHWPLGLIIKTCPGRDGVVRIAEVKTKGGIYKRPVVKLCPLPVP